MKKVQQDKINGSCEYRCPPIKNDTEPQCYQQDLLLGKAIYILKQGDYREETQIPISAKNGPFEWLGEY